MINTQLTKQKVAVITLGCKTNQFESSAIAEAVRKKGYDIVPFSEFADIYIINTCTVTAKSDAESRRLIRRARRQNEKARIVVTGCYAQLEYEEISRFPGVDLVLGNNEKKELVELLDRIEERQIVKVSDVSKGGNGNEAPLEIFTENTRAFLQVQNGCDAFCSYCIVPYVRGSSRSVPIEVAISSVRAFADKGYKEVVLTGIHLGMYGPDLNPPTGFLELIAGIEKETPIARLRVGSLEPGEVSDGLIDFISGSRIFCPHLHIPLQSGDDQLLSKMNRHYSTRFYGNLIEKITENIPGICIGTDIIVGFPGESERQFENTLLFLESLPLAYFHVFPFSVRRGTPAADMPDKVHPAVIKERAKILRKLSENKRKAYFETFIGKELEVLVQEKSADGSWKGLSRNYIPVKFERDNLFINSEISGTVKEVGRDVVCCVAVDR